MEPQATIADTRPCITIKLCKLLAKKGTSVDVGARLQGTYQQPSTGIAIRWHTNSVIPIAKGAKTCKNINTSIRVPYKTLPSTPFGPKQVQVILQLIRQ